MAELEKIYCNGSWSYKKTNEAHPNFCVKGGYRYSGAQVYYAQKADPKAEFFLCDCGNYHRK